MSIVAITIAQEFNPIEVQAWLDANAGATIYFVVSHDNLMYIFYDEENTNV